MALFGGYSRSRSRKRTSGKRPRYSNTRRRRSGVHHRSTRPNVDTLTSLFSRLNPTGQITKAERVPMKVEKKVVDAMDELTSMFGKMTGYKKRKSKLGIRTKKSKRRKNPFA